MDELDVIRNYNSSRQKRAADLMWSSVRLGDRRERTAVMCYAKQAKLYGKDQADQWLVNRFGREKAGELLLRPNFRRQWIKYL